MIQPRYTGWRVSCSVGWVLISWLLSPAALAQHSRPAFRLPSTEWHIESVAYNTRTHELLLGDVRQRQVWIRSVRGAFRPLLTSATDTVWSVLGMAIDEPRQVLWLASTAGPEMRGYQPADSGRTALLRCSLPTGTLTRFEIPVDGQRHALGDVVVDRVGTVYVSDSRTPTLYRLRPGASQLDSWLRLPGGYSPQGMALSADEQTLHVADYGVGLFRIDLRRGQASVVPLPAGVSLQGIDGLCRVGQGLIAIQNGMGHKRVIALELDASGQSIKRVKILENRAAVLPEPTLGTRVGSWFYFVANSPWSRYSSTGSSHRLHRLAPLYIRRIQL